MSWPGRTAWCRAPAHSPLAKRSPAASSRKSAIVGGLHAALRLLVSVIEVPGGVAIKGGRPSQASVQLGPGMFVDPATGLSQVRLPDDAIDSVTVLPNPYAVEYGRFSSGLVLIQTRRAADRWKTRLNSLDPSFRTKRHEPLKIIGIASFAPRLETGGPLIKDRLFLQEAAQYRYRTSEVPSRPQEDLKTAHAFSSFTRLDANLSARHVLVAAGGFFPSVSKFATLGTFTPPNAAADLDSGVNALSVTERSLWTDALFSETTVEMNRYRSEVLPQSVPADGAAAGDDARQLLQSPDAHHLDVSADRNALGLAERKRRPAPVQGRARSPAQPVLRERAPAHPS